MARDHRMCPEWTTARGRVVKCKKRVGHDESHWGEDVAGRDVVWQTVVLHPPSAG